MTSLIWAVKLLMKLRWSEANLVFFFNVLYIARQVLSSIFKALLSENSSCDIMNDSKGCQGLLFGVNKIKINIERKNDKTPLLTDLG